jgi:serine protease AprX
MADTHSTRDQIRRNLMQTTITHPLLGKVLDAINNKSDQEFSVIIDPDLDFKGGREEACERIKALVASARDNVEKQGKSPGPDPNIRHSSAHPYVFATLNADVIVEIVKQDGNSSSDNEQKYTLTSSAGKQRLVNPRQAIYRIWEDPEIEALIVNSLATVKADAAHAAFTADGKDIVWAVIDSGIDREHSHFNDPSLMNLQELPSPLDHVDFTGANAPLVDEYGHGSHVAGIIAGRIDESEQPTAVIRARDEINGKISSALKPLKHTVSGMAPRCKLLSLKVLDKNGKGKASAAIEAIAQIQKWNDFGRRVIVHGVNMSVGYPFMPEWFACGESPLCVEVNRLVRSGVVVVVAAGNSGYGAIAAQFGGISSAGLALTINDPGNAEYAITVGSTHRDMPHTYGVSYFSSKGPTGDGRLKPDLVAPGERILSCAAGTTKKEARQGLPDSMGTQDFHYVEDSGTSMAAPHVSGVIAAFLSIRREYIGKPEEVKKLFMDNATDLKRDRTFQGCGLVDLMRAIQAV